MSCAADRGKLSRPTDEPSVVAGVGGGWCSRVRRHRVPSATIAGNEPTRGLPRGLLRPLLAYEIAASRRCPRHDDNGYRRRRISSGPPSWRRRGRPHGLIPRNSRRFPGIRARTRADVFTVLCKSSRDVFARVHIVMRDRALQGEPIFVKSPDGRERLNRRSKSGNIASNLSRHDMCVHATFVTPRTIRAGFSSRFVSLGFPRATLPAAIRLCGGKSGSASNCRPRFLSPRRNVSRVLEHPVCTRTHVCTYIDD